MTGFQMQRCRPGSSWGRRVFADANARAERVVNEMFSGFTDAEIDTVLGVLSRFVRPDADSSRAL
ncbi:MAG TPA: hypothetical protein VMK84_27010 [Streptosporangiaceae bacterium]|nr:hypothetical protein [Streptosporangiaceae bacterium]